MRALIVLALLCAACAGPEGEPPSAEKEQPGSGTVQADSAKSDVTGPNGPRTGG